MKCKNVWMSRHGIREWQIQALDLLEIPPGAPMGGDDPLDPMGEQQAEALAERLADVPIRYIFSSPFRRTIQTTLPLARRLNLPIKLEWGLCEYLQEKWFDNFPQLPSVAEHHREFPEVDLMYHSQVMPEFPESREQMFRRTAEAIKRLTENFGPDIFVMGHSPSTQGMRRALLPEKSDFNVDFCGLSHLQREGDSWRYLLDGDGEHLRENGLHVSWPPEGWRQTLNATPVNSTN